MSKQPASSPVFSQDPTLVLELGSQDSSEEGDDESEYSGMVSSWRSGDVSIDLLSTPANSLDNLDTRSSPEAQVATRVFRSDARRWKHDKLCR